MLVAPPDGFDGPPSGRSILRQQRICVDRPWHWEHTPPTIQCVRRAPLLLLRLGIFLHARVIIVHHPHLTLDKVCPASPSVALGCGISDIALASLAGLSEPRTSKLVSHDVMQLNLNIVLDEHIQSSNLSIILYDSLHVVTSTSSWYQCEPLPANFHD